MLVRPGYWSHVFTHPEGLAWVWVTREAPNTVVCEVNPADPQVERWRSVVQLPDGSQTTPRYLKAAASPAGRICLVGQAQDGQGCVIGLSSPGTPVVWHAWSPCFVDPGVAWNGQEFVVLVPIDGKHYMRLSGFDQDWNQMYQVPLPGKPDGTTHGWTRIDAGLQRDGSQDALVWWDDTRVRVFGDLTIMNTQEEHGAVVGQSLTNPIMTGVIGGIEFMALNAPPEEPRLAWSAERNRWAVCSWTQQNTACYDEFPPYHALPAPPPPPEPPSVVYPTIRDFAQPKSIAVFKDLEGVSGSDSEIVIDGAVQKSTRRCWAGIDLDGGFTAIDRANGAGRLIGIAAEGFGARGYDAGRKKADALHTRLSWWNDGPEIVYPPSGLGEDDQCWAEWYQYLEHGEFLVDAIERWKRVYDLAQKTKCRVLGGIPQFFDRLLFSPQQVADIIGAAFDLFGGESRVQVFAPFEFNRGDHGISGHPVCQEMYRRLLKANVKGALVLGPLVPAPAPQPATSGGLLIMSAFSSNLRVLRHYGRVVHDGSKKVSYTADPKSGEVFSIQPDGAIGKSAKGAFGIYEQFLEDRLTTGLATVRPVPPNFTGNLEDVTYTFAVMDISGL